MATITIDYNESSSLAQIIIKLIRESGEFIIRDSTKDKYNPAFVQEILESEESEGKHIEIKDLWN